MKSIKQCSIEKTNSYDNSQSSGEFNQHLVDIFKQNNTHRTKHRICGNERKKEGKKST